MGWCGVSHAAVVCFRMSKLEAEDPEYMAAVREYHQQLSRREVLSLEHLLLRVNSTAHMRTAVTKIFDKARVEYEQVLDTYGMDKARELSALEGALENASEVRHQVSWHARRFYNAWFLPPIMSSG